MRTLRSIGQGALVVDFALYLHALHWSGLAIGLVLSSTGFFGAGLSLLVGLTSDWLRRRPFLLSYEVLSLLSGIAALLTEQPIILTIAAKAGLAAAQREPQGLSRRLNRHGSLKRSLRTGEVGSTV
jgi:hypothetical protein